MSIKRQSIRTIVKTQQKELEQAVLTAPTLTTPPIKLIPTQTVERIKPGYSLRKDLLRECKRIAFDEERNIYEIIEEGLQMVINSRKKLINST
jgi:hypothetical protein